MIINIVGVKYKVIKVKTKEEMCDSTNYGEIDYNNRTIKLLTIDHDGVPLDDKWIQQTLLHEVAHGFLRESGQEDINTERIVEVISKFSGFSRDINYK